MNENDLKEFSGAMRALCSNFGGTLDPAQMKMYFITLQRHSMGQIKKAVILILQNKRERIMPTIAEIIDVIEGRKDKKSVKGLAVIEWINVEKALKAYGGSRIETAFEHPTTNYLLTEKWDYKTKADTMIESDFKQFKWDFIEAFQALEISKTDILDYKTTERITDLKNNGDVKQLASGLTRRIE